MSKVKVKGEKERVGGNTGKSWPEQTFLWLFRIYVWIWMLLLIVVQPFYCRDGYSTIGSDKYLFLKSCGVTLFPALGILVIARLLLWGYRIVFGSFHSVGKSVSLRLSVTDVFALLYGAVNILSLIGSNYVNTAIFGEDKWYMGFATQMGMLLLYFGISRYFDREDWIAALFLPVSGVVFLLGILNRFGIYPIAMTSAQPSYISTIGNINWYCGYVVTILFGAVYLFWSGVLQKRWQQVVLWCYLLIGFGTLVTQGSSSGILTLFVLFLILFFASIRDGGRMERFFTLVLLLGCSCTAGLLVRLLWPEAITFEEATLNLMTYSIMAPVLLVVGMVGYRLLARKNSKAAYPAVFFEKLGKGVKWALTAGLVLFVLLGLLNTWKPGSIGPLSGISYFTFNVDWGSNRGATWKAGFLCFAEQNLAKKLIGIGPDCMWAYISQDGSDALYQVVQTQFGSARLTNAHNEWLTLLVNVGILGLVSFVGMIGSAVIRFLSAGNTFSHRTVDAWNEEEKKAAGGYAIQRQKGAGAKGGRTSLTENGSLKKEVTGVFAAVCGFCILAYTVNNVVSFEQAMSTPTMFLILGMGEAWLRRRQISE